MSWRRFFNQIQCWRSTIQPCVWEDEGIPVWANWCFFFHYTRGIDSYYVEGVSLTHGGVGRRQHIWTFAAGVSEVSNDLPNHSCPCDTGNYDRVPAFVGNFFFVRVAFTQPGMFSLFSFPMMSSGMVRTVLPTAHAVSSTTLHGLQRICPLQQLMTLSWGSV